MEESVVIVQSALEAARELNVISSDTYHHLSGINHSFCDSPHVPLNGLNPDKLLDVWKVKAQNSNGAISIMEAVLDKVGPNSSEQDLFEANCSFQDATLAAMHYIEQEHFELAD